METIDVSGTATILRAFGHSYIADSPRVLRDFRELLFHHTGAAQRGLPTFGTVPKQYWRLD